jgi:hypothetical protein
MPINTELDYNIYLSSFHGLTSDWIVKSKNKQVDPNIKLMHVNNKRSWSEYYQYYTKEKFIDCMILKCDDDICMIDLSQFKNFVDNARENKDKYLLAFPHIVNNEMVAYYAQSFGLIPVDEVGEFFYEPKGSGRLWRDGIKTERLHNYFLNNTQDYIAKSKQLDNVLPIPQNDRISINMFAIHSDNLDVLNMVKNDDEYELTQLIPGKMKKTHYIDMTFVVSHLSFFKQRDTGFNDAIIIKKYDDLCKFFGIFP